MNFLIAQDLSTFFYNIVVPDAFHTQCWLRFDDPVVIYLSFYDYTASKNLVKIHLLFFSSRKANGTIFSLSSWCSQGTSHKNTLFHWKSFVFHCFLHVVPYSTRAIWSLIFFLLTPHHSLTTASLLLICHELDFRSQKSSNRIFKERSNGEDTTHSWKAEVGSYLWKSSDNLCRVCCSVPLSRSLMTILTSTEPSISPRDTPPETGVQLKFVSLITTL